MGCKKDISVITSAFTLPKTLAKWQGELDYFLLIPHRIRDKSAVHSFWRANPSQVNLVLVEMELLFQSILLGIELDLALVAEMTLMQIATEISLVLVEIPSAMGYILVLALALVEIPSEMALMVEMVEISSVGSCLLGVE
jgi:hypothetical protein